MSPRINLVVDGGHNRVYRPGDTISGHVVLHCSTSEDVKCVLVNFTGCVNIVYRRRTHGRNNNTHYYRDENVLFSIDSRLFVGPYTISEGPHEWPFEFVVPTGSTDYGPSGQQQTSLLPATLSGERMKGEQYNLSSDCFITYELEATMERPSMFKIDARAKQRVIFLPWSPSPPGPTQQFECRADHLHTSSRLQPGREKVSRSFKDSFKDALALHNAPSVAFVVKCSITDTNVDGGLQAWLTVDLDPSRSTATIVPEFAVSRMQATLIASTSMLNRRYDHNGNPSVFHVEIPIGQVTRNTANLLTIGQPSRLFAPLGNVPPSFVSRFVSRWYGVTFEIEITCAGKTFKSEFSAPVNIMAPAQVDAGSMVQQGLTDNNQFPSSPSQVGGSYESGIASPVAKEPVYNGQQY